MTYLSLFLALICGMTLAAEETVEAPQEAVEAQSEAVEVEEVLISSVAVDAPVESNWKIVRD
jgi:hypothetical protein